MVSDFKGCPIKSVTVAFSAGSRSIFGSCCGWSSLPIGILYSREPRSIRPRNITRAVRFLAVASGPVPLLTFSNGTYTEPTICRLPSFADIIAMPFIVTPVTLRSGFPLKWLSFKQYKRIARIPVPATAGPTAVGCLSKNIAIVPKKLLPDSLSATRPTTSRITRGRGVQ